MQRATRGFGLLENYLARRRAAMADRLIYEELRDGHVLDIGCGHDPFFLRSTSFGRKSGIDRQEIAMPEGPHETVIRIYRVDVAATPSLPFDDGALSVVTMLAVWEHLSPDVLRQLAADIHRALRPGGQLVITTPSPWTGGILSMLSATGFVSHQEIDEHDTLHGHGGIRSMLTDAGFGGEIRAGYFECFLNQWVAARKAA